MNFCSFEHYESWKNVSVFHSLSLLLTIKYPSSSVHSSSSRKCQIWPAIHTWRMQSYITVIHSRSKTRYILKKMTKSPRQTVLKGLYMSSCHRVARYRTEAVVFAQGASSLKAELEEYEYQLECQSKELTALRLEHSSLREELTAANLQNEQLLDRWLEEKKEEGWED